MKIATTSKPFHVTGQDCVARLRERDCEFVEPKAFGPLSGRELIDAVGDAEILIADLDQFSPDTYAALPNLRMIARWGVGYDAVNIEAATAAGVMVTNTPGVLEETVADLTFALLLGIARQVPQAAQSMAAGNWSPKWASDVHGKTLGLIGCGRIGLAVARRALGFNMRVIAFDLHPSEAARSAGVVFQSLDDVLAEADFVSLHAALTEDSRNLIGPPQLRRMKPTAFLINTARGKLVDESALAEALNSGEIAGAALDAFCVEPLPAEHPLRTARNTLLTPHMASFTTDNGRRISETATEAIIDLLEGRPPRNLVNPDVFRAPGLRCKLS